MAFWMIVLKWNRFSPSVKKSKFITNIFLGIYFVFAKNNFNCSLF